MMVSESAGGWSATRKHLLSSGGKHIVAGSAHIEGDSVCPPVELVCPNVMGCPSIIL